MTLATLRYESSGDWIQLLVNSDFIGHTFVNETRSDGIQSASRLVIPLRCWDGGGPRDTPALLSSLPAPHPPYLVVCISLAVPWVLLSHFSKLLNWGMRLKLQPRQTKMWVTLRLDTWYWHLKWEPFNYETEPLYSLTIVGSVRIELEDTWLLLENAVENTLYIVSEEIPPTLSYLLRNLFKDLLVSSSDFDSSLVWKYGW